MNDCTPAQRIAVDVIPRAYRILPPALKDPRATVLLLAIGLQESRFERREQVGGPARGFWQFERGGGVRGVLRHWSTRTPAAMACAARDCPVLPNDVYLRIAEDDILACAFARLLLFTDPAPLPDIGEHDEAWRYYVRTWRPGKPHQRTWRKLYDEAVATVRGA